MRITTSHGGATIAAAVIVGLAAIGGAEGGKVKVMNRISADCVIEGPDVSIPIPAKSEKDVRLDDSFAGKLKAVCQATGLDKNVSDCDILIGGAGGSGVAKDIKFGFKYVTQIHVNSQLNMFLVCTAM